MQISAFRAKMWTIIGVETQNFAGWCLTHHRCRTVCMFHFSRTMTCMDDPTFRLSNMTAVQIGSSKRAVSMVFLPRASSHAKSSISNKHPTYTAYHTCSLMHH